MSAPPDAPTREGEPRRALWLVVLAPTVWILVFVLIYASVAVACARGAPVDGAIGPVRYVAFLIAGAALLVIAAVGFVGWRRASKAGTEVDQGSRARERFVGWSTVLLSGLSAVATLYVGLTLAMFGGCS